ncbi:unnamed protein product, partial [Ectocarpus sp. 8 AP-2014]
AAQSSPPPPTGTPAAFTPPVLAGLGLPHPDDSAGASSAAAPPTAPAAGWCRGENPTMPALDARSSGGVPSTGLRGGVPLRERRGDGDGNDCCFCFCCCCCCCCCEELPAAPPGAYHPSPTPPTPQGEGGGHGDGGQAPLA